MPLAPAHFIEGIGELDAAWFPVLEGEAYTDAADKLDTLLTAWIAKATALSYAIDTDGDAGEAYVYLRAYRYLVRHWFVFRAASATVSEKGGFKFEDWQLDEVKALADDWQTKVDGLTLSVTDRAFAVVRSLR